MPDGSAGLDKRAGAVVDAAMPSPTPAAGTDAPEPHAPVAGPSRLPPPRRALFYPRGAQPEIIRANQKDVFVVDDLSEQVETVFRNLFGTRWLQTWGNEVRVGSKLAYFVLTTFLGTQTLGEEYCDIMQYTASDQRLPTATRRASLISLHVVAPYLLARAYGVLRRRWRDVRAREGLDDPATAARARPVGEKRWSFARLRRTVLAIEPPPFDELIGKHFTAVHLAVFYLYGRYYHLSKRLVGVRYLSTQSRPDAGNSRPPSYEVLGVLMAIQLIVRFALAARPSTEASAPPVSELKGKGKAADAPKRPKPTIDGVPLDLITFDPEDPSARSEDGDADEGEDPAESQARRCTLCLATRKDPAATECGHVFCWECIVGWAREKAECPLCRQGITLPALLPIYNI